MVAVLGFAVLGHRNSTQSPFHEPATDGLVVHLIVGMPSIGKSIPVFSLGPKVGKQKYARPFHHP